MPSGNDEAMSIHLEEIAFHLVVQPWYIMPGLCQLDQWF